MEHRFKCGIMRHCTAVYGCETTGLLTAAAIDWHSASLFNASVIKCRDELNTQQSTLAYKR